MAGTERPKLRIGFIGGRGLVGTYSGIETYYHEVGSRLVARGHDVTAYCRSHFTPRLESSSGIRIRRHPTLRTKHLETLSHSLIATLDCLFRGFDIVQYHAIGSSFLAGLPRLTGCTTIVSVRGLDWQRAKWNGLARFALKLGERASARVPSATVVVSETLADHYERRYGERPFVVQNAVDSTVRQTSRSLDQFDLRKNGYILYTGRISPEKGVHTLLEAMRPLRRGMKIVLAGGSSYSDSYIRDIERKSWDDVIFLGNVDHGFVQVLLRNCFAYVLPSEMEGLSIALLEAVSHGVCIVTTNIPENLEVVGSAALTFPPGDVQALRSHLQLLLDDPSVVAELQGLARLRAGRLPDWEEVARQTEELYYQVLRETTRKRPGP